jgi:hypothetical protein
MTNAIVNTSNTITISKQVNDYADQFKGYALKTAESIIMMAKVVYEAKNALKKDEFEVFCTQVGYKSDSSTIRKLNSIGQKYEFLLSRSKSLPSNWTTMYQVSRLTTDLIDQKINEGVINPHLDGKNLAIRLGLDEPKPVPNGTDESMSFTVNLPLAPTLEMKIRLKMLIADLEGMKAEVEKSNSLEKFLVDTESNLAKAA